MYKYQHFIHVFFEIHRFFSNTRKVYQTHEICSKYILYKNMFQSIIFLSLQQLRQKIDEETRVNAEIESFLRAHQMVSWQKDVLSLMHYGNLDWT